MIGPIHVILMLILPPFGNADSSDALPPCAPVWN